MKRFFSLVVVLMLCSVPVSAGTLTEEARGISHAVAKGLDPLAEDASFAGESILRGVGSLVFLPFQLIQDALNAVFLGASGEELFERDGGIPAVD